MNISVAICTWNRANLLDKTLDGIGKVRIPDGLKWEVLVVNNNCTDHTDEVIARHMDSLPIRRIFEPEQGLSQARNRVLQETRSEFIAFLDDDVIVIPEWIHSFYSATKRWPNAGYFAGAVFPWYENPPKHHVAIVLNELANGTYLGLNLGQDERQLNQNESPRGANLLIRRCAAEGLVFDPTLGRTKDKVWFGDETDYCNQIRARGHYGVWVPSASLQHFVPSERVGLDYLRQYFLGLGTSMVRQGDVADVAKGKHLAGIPFWTLRAFGEAFVGKYLRLLQGDKVGYFRGLTKQWRCRGIIQEFRRMNSRLGHISLD